MKVTDYLKESQMDLNLPASSKEDAIKKLAALLREAKAVSDYQGFIKDVFEREALNTTGIGHDIAIPHARTDAVKDFVIAFGRVTAGLEFGALDKKPVKLIFLMGTPKEKELHSYLKILSALTRRLDKESFREQLLNASAPKEIIEIFKRVER
ncbi:MAG: PTS sugar transporter subunit IIA [Candidatus Omnitrophota bacterium]